MKRLACDAKAQLIEIPHITYVTRCVDIDDLEVDVRPADHQGCHVEQSRRRGERGTHPRRGPSPMIAVPCLLLLCISEVQVHR